MTRFSPCRCVWPLVLLAGCDTAPPAVPTPATPSALAAGPPQQPGRPPADKPDLARLQFDASTGTLTLYRLPARGGRWLLVTPDHPDGTPVSGKVSVPADTDPDRASVFYTLPDQRPSPRVTLREIADAQTLHASR